eukprot:366119-Chlamydomonas_euryale.AAC.19
MTNGGNVPSAMSCEAVCAARQLAPLNDARSSYRFCPSCRYSTGQPVRPASEATKPGGTREWQRWQRLPLRTFKTYVQSMCSSCSAYRRPCPTCMPVTVLGSRTACSQLAHMACLQPACMSGPERSCVWQVSLVGASGMEVCVHCHACSRLPDGVQMRKSRSGSSSASCHSTRSSLPPAIAFWCSNLKSLSCRETQYTRRCQRCTGSRHAP